MKPKNIYWTEQTSNAFLAYIYSTDEDFKSRIYRKYIYVPLDDVINHFLYRRVYNQILHREMKAEILVYLFEYSFKPEHFDLSFLSKSNMVFYWITRIVRNAVISESKKLKYNTDLEEYMPINEEGEVIEIPSNDVVLENFDFTKKTTDEESEEMGFKKIDDIMEKYINQPAKNQEVKNLIYNHYQNYKNNKIYKQMSFRRYLRTFGLKNHSEDWGKFLKSKYQIDSYSVNYLTTEYIKKNNIIYNEEENEKEESTFNI